MALACSSAPNGTIQLITGEENDTFSRQPMPTKLTVDSVDLSGKRSTLATASLPTSGIDLESVGADTSGTLEVTGTGSDGGRLVYGQSLPVVYGALDGQTIPIFVQRTGELARMPPLPEARSWPTLAVMSGRFLFVGAGSDSTLAKTSQLYDFAYFTALGTPPSLPRPPKSVVFVGSVAWLIDENGADAFDFAQNTAVSVSVPPGGSFSEVAGGATVYASDGTQYIVGATRTAPQGSTKTVLVVDPNGANPDWATLSGDRLGSAATWVDSYGLVVTGGSETLPGVEVIGPNSKAGSALCFPPDSSAGSGATMLDGEHVLLVGGMTPTGDDAGVRVIDLTSTASCTPTPWPPLPIVLATAQAFASDSATALVVGSDPSGATHVFRVTSSAAVELPTKANHVGARAIVSPTGSIVLYGGAREVESYAP